MSADRKDPTYRDYVHDAAFMEKYRKYQERYAHSMRESDRRLLEMASGLLAGVERPSVLDLGCSTGNLLFHARNLLPEADFFGGDMAAEVIARNRQDERLSGIVFLEMDMLDFVPPRPMDLVVTSAATYCLDFDEYPKAVAAVSAALKPGGWYLSFDWFHPAEQELVILEYSSLFPEGHKLTSRSYGFVRRTLAEAGFEEPSFEPFDIPIDLPPPPPGSISTHTVRTESGSRLCFRGALHQPWCFLAARKKPS